jgi:hypothetical protein
MPGPVHKCTGLLANRIPVYRNRLRMLRMPMEMTCPALKSAAGGRHEYISETFPDWPG